MKGPLEKPLISILSLSENVQGSAITYIEGINQKAQLLYTYTRVLASELLVLAFQMQEPRDSEDRQ